MSVGQHFLADGFTYLLYFFGYFVDGYLYYLLLFKNVYELQLY